MKRTYTRLILKCSLSLLFLPVQATLIALTVSAVSAISIAAFLAVVTSVEVAKTETCFSILFLDSKDTY